MNYSLIIISCSFLIACGATPTPQVNPPINQDPNLDKPSQSTEKETPARVKDGANNVVTEASESEKKRINTVSKRYN